MPKPATMRKGAKDDFQTPPEALKPLLPYIKKSWKVWECAEGNGNLVKAFKKEGYDVIGTDILTGKDFLTYEPKDYDVIVTNPPYSTKFDFLERAYELGKPFAFLLPLTTLESKKRQQLFDKHGIEVILVDKRINFETPNGDGSSSWFATAWFTNGLNVGSELTFESLGAFLGSANQDFVTITSNDNWFKQHPEKIAGVEFETTSIYFPIQVKGTKEDVLRVTGMLNNNKMTYEQFIDKSNQLEKETDILHKKVNAFPKLPDGRIPDDVRKSDEYKKANKDWEIGWKKLQDFNKSIPKEFKQRRYNEKLKSNDKSNKLKLAKAKAAAAQAKLKLQQL